jgi:hypothetical protein
MSTAAPHLETPKWLERSAKAILVLNLIDAVCTLLVVTAGLAVEANPLMARLLQGGTVPFMIGKQGLVSAGVLVLWRLRSNRLAVAGLMAALPVYCLLVLYHLSMEIGVL